MRTSVYSTSRWYKQCNSSTQRRNPLHQLPLPWKRHFHKLTGLAVGSDGPSYMSIPPHKTLGMHNTEQLGYSKDSDEVWCVSAILKWVNSVSKVVLPYKLQCTTDSRVCLTNEELGRHETILNLHIHTAHKLSAQQCFSH